MKKQRKKRTAAIAVSLYLLGTFLIVGMLRVYRITHDTIHHEPLPATAVTQTEDAYVLSVLHYSTTVRRSDLFSVRTVYKRLEPFLPATVRMTISGCGTLLALSDDSGTL